MAPSSVCAVFHGLRRGGVCWHTASENASRFSEKHQKNGENGNSSAGGTGSGSKPFARRFHVPYVSESCGSGPVFKHFLATCHSHAATWGTGPLELGWLTCGGDLKFQKICTSPFFGRFFGSGWGGMSMLRTALTIHTVDLCTGRPFACIRHHPMHIPMGSCMRCDQNRASSTQKRSILCIGSAFFRPKKINPIVKKIFCVLTGKFKFRFFDDCLPGVETPFGTS